MSSEGYAGALARRGWTIGRNQRFEIVVGAGVGLRLAHSTRRFITIALDVGYPTDGYVLETLPLEEAQARFPVLGDLAAYLARRGLHEVAGVHSDVLDALSPPEVLALFVVRFGKGGLP